MNAVFMTLLHTLKYLIQIFLPYLIIQIPKYFFSGKDKNKPNNYVSEFC